MILNYIYYRTVYSRITWDLQKFIIIFDKEKLKSIFQIEKFFIKKWSYDMSDESIDAFIESRYKYIVMKSYQKMMSSNDSTVNSLNLSISGNIPNVNKSVLNITN